MSMHARVSAAGFALLTIGIICAPNEAGAQAFPVKVVRVVNPAAPGGNSDIIFRLIQPKMSEVLGQPVVMDYRPGAGGIVGIELTAKSTPDGYTTALVAASFQFNPAVRAKLSYDAVKDFTPLGLIVDLPGGLVVHPSMPVKTVKELLALAKARPSQILYSTSGAGGVGHLAMELLSSMAGVRMTHVPYKGAGPSVIDLVGGHVQAAFVSVPLILGHVQSGRLRMLAQGGAKRSESLPDVPTVQEAGVAGFVVSSGFNFLGPAGIPRPIAERLNAALAQAIHDPAIRKQLVAQGADPIGSSMEEHAAFIKSEVEKWIKVARQANIRLE